MQNATQALLMAASVMLGVILLATLVYVLRMGGNVNKQYDETQLNYQTEGFNYQFEVYQRDDNTIMDMINLLNLAYSTNSANGYDVNNSVIIILNIGNKTYRIPQDLSKDANTFYDDNKDALSRNQVYEVSKGAISVYDLINKTLYDLGIDKNCFSGAKDSDKLSKIHIGKYVYYPDRPVGSPDFGKPEIGDNGTTYKYVFDCDDSAITYNKVTGKISKMEFNCVINPYWELGSFWGSAGYTNPPKWD